MNIEITYSKKDEQFIGADIWINVDYLKQSFVLSLVLNRKCFGHIWEDNLEHAIQGYTAQNAELEQLNASDIDGAYQLQLKKENAEFVEFKSINDTLKYILDVQ